MIISLSVSIKEILYQGRNSKWIGPAACPVCAHDRLWGHGFVLAHFDELNQGIWLKRWRCPSCGAVHRAKPEGYFKRFQACVAQIRDSLSRRLTTGFWPPGLSRGRQGHWLRGPKRHVVVFLGLPFHQRLLEGFDLLREMGRIPVSRSI